MKRLLLALALISWVDANTTTDDVYDAKGNRVGTIRESPNSYEVFDKNGNRIGTGRVQLDGRIRVYDPKTLQPLYEIKERPENRRRRR